MTPSLSHGQMFTRKIMIIIIRKDSILFWNRVIVQSIYYVCAYEACMIIKIRKPYILFLLATKYLISNVRNKSNSRPDCLN